METPIPTHILVPKHEVLGAEESQKVLERYGITRAELPKILDDDPALENLKAKSGDIIKITRKSATRGEAMYYRVVISG